MAIKTLVVWNPNAGRVDGVAELRQSLEDDPTVELFEPAEADQATARVESACIDRISTIIAAGGDGTVNSVINGMRKASDQTALGVLPLGTANDWCASLGLPDDPMAALDLIRTAVPQPVDVAELETSSRTMWFANIATGGNSHRVTESITPEQKQTWGAMCYVINGFAILGDLKSFQADIKWSDGSHQSCSVWNMIVANGQTSGGRLKIAPHAKINDGLLDIVVVEEGNLVDVASLAGLYLFDDFIKSERITYRQATHIEIRSTPSIKFSIDGDLVDDEPIRFRVVQGAIQTYLGPDAAVI